jgi:hypothetical protein
MLYEIEKFIFVPFIVLAATAALAMAVALYAEWRTQRALRAAQPAAAKFRPVLIHDRSRQTLLRSRGPGRQARPKIRLVYNGG